MQSYDVHDRFDVVHARYVLIHVPDFLGALAHMIRCVAPGGWLVLEEPDFSAARCVAGPAEPFERTNLAIDRMFSLRSLDAALGRRLPQHVENAGLALRAVENDAPVAQGGSKIALMMSRSAEQPRDRYVATGLASGDDVDGYRRFATDPSTRAIYYSTVRTIARRA